MVSVKKRSDKMKRLFYIPLLVIMVAMLMSCEMESSHGGKLDGYWHLERIDTLHAASADYGQKKVFWAIQGHLIQMTDRDYQYSSLISRYERQGDSLILERPYYNERDKGDPEVEELIRLQFYGLGSWSPRFRIENLSSERMTLSDGNVILQFRKL